MEEEKVYSMPLIGDRAPEFVAETTQGTLHFPQDYVGKWVILFSHPADFTPVCSTEFMTFASRAEEFKAINTELVGLSVDGLYSHIAWLRKLQEFEWKDIKHPHVQFPLIADGQMKVASLYGMIHHQSSTATIRAVFIIDPKGVIRTILYYPASTGRNVDEIKRIVVALQTADKENVATPADWKPGEDVILPIPGSCGTAKAATEVKDKDVTVYDWFLRFKKEEK